MYTIYQLIDPGTKELMYIGITTNDIYLRLAQHINDAFQRSRTFDQKQVWLKKLFKGGLLPIISVLEKTTDKGRERKWIRDLNPTLNLVHSGITNELHLYINENKRKLIYQYDLDGKYIRSWPSLIQAAFSLNIKIENICHCLKHRRKRAGDYMWSFVLLDKLSPYSRDYSSSYQTVHLYTMELVYIKTYESMASAKVDGFDVKGISRCCTGERKSYRGHKFSKFKI